MAPTSGGRDLIDAAFTDHMANEHRLVSALTPAQQTRLAELLHIWVGAFEGDTHHS